MEAVWWSCDVVILTEAERNRGEEEMELWEKIRARSLGTCDRWSRWISCPSLCDSSCRGHFVCSNSTMEVGWEWNLCFPRRFGSKITSQCCPMWGDLSWWQSEMRIKDRVERGVKSVSHYYHSVCCGRRCKTGEDVRSLLKPWKEPFWACPRRPLTDGDQTRTSPGLPGKVQNLEKFKRLLEFNFPLLLMILFCLLSLCVCVCVSEHDRWPVCE